MGANELTLHFPLKSVTYFHGIQSSSPIQFQERGATRSPLSDRNSQIVRNIERIELLDLQVYPVILAEHESKQ
jgi:hypothetical protein